MGNTVAQMSKKELQEMIEDSIERKLIEVLGDPDKGLRIRKSLRDRLLRQQKAFEAGDCGKPFGVVARQLGLE